MTLDDWVSSFGGDLYGTRAEKYAKVEVVAEHRESKGGRDWPLKHRNVWWWVELANGYGVGLNENPNKGWSYPVASKKAVAG